MRGDLVPKRVVRQDGVETTVWVKPEEASAFSAGQRIQIKPPISPSRMLYGEQEHPVQARADFTIDGVRARVGIIDGLDFQSTDNLAYGSIILDDGTEVTAWMVNGNLKHTLGDGSQRSGWYVPADQETEENLSYQITGPQYDALVKAGDIANRIGYLNAGMNIDNTELRVANRIRDLAGKTDPVVHDQNCEAHAIGCAVENIIDGQRSTDPEVRKWAATADPISEGRGYLRDGIASCLCDGSGADQRDYVKWIQMGNEAMDLRELNNQQEESAAAAPAFALVTDLQEGDEIVTIHDAGQRYDHPEDVGDPDTLQWSKVKYKSGPRPSGPRDYGERQMVLEGPDGTEYTERFPEDLRVLKRRLQP